MSDKEIIIKIRSGQIDEFAHIVKAYTRQIFAYIQNKIEDKNEAEDLTQNTFLNFYRSINRFNVGKPVSPYLYAIARNELKMYWRAKKMTVPLNESLTIEPLHSENDYEGVEAVELINQLPVQQRQTLELITRGFSYKEIAEIMKKPINTIRTIIRRGRLKLKSLYEKTT